MILKAFFENIETAIIGNKLLRMQSKACL